MDSLVCYNLPCLWGDLHRSNARVTRSTQQIGARTPCPQADDKLHGRFWTLLTALPCHTGMVLSQRSAASHKDLPSLARVG